MTIDIDKLASDIVGAIWDDYEDEKIVSRARWEEIVKKTAKSHVDKMSAPPGGFGVGAFLVAASSFDTPDWLRPGAVVGVKKNGDLYDCRHELYQTTLRAVREDVAYELCGRPGATCTVTPDRLVLRDADGAVLVEHSFDEQGNPSPLELVDFPLLPDED